MCYLEKIKNKNIYNRENTVIRSFIRKINIDNITTFITYYLLLHQ